jgi:ferric-dicitrate binding protein FerR (iron transport regulator)
MSVLTVASGFGSAIREVTLQGEAVFTVSHVTGQPFIVRTSASTTRVLGTIFDVRAYAGDTESRVTVQQGRVAMNAVVLSAGDIGVSTETGTAPVVQHSPSIARVLDWTQGVLSFQDTPLRDVAEQLSRWYDVDFVVRDSLVGQLPLSTTIRASETIDSTMSLIAITTGTVVERHGRTVTISRATHARYIPELPAPSELAMKSRMQHTS